MEHDTDEAEVHIAEYVAICVQASRVSAIDTKKGGENMAKVCPMQFSQALGAGELLTDFPDCIEDECEFWDDQRNECAILSISKALKAIAQQLT